MRLERVDVRGTVDRHLRAIEASHFIESALGVSFLRPARLPGMPATTVGAAFRLAPDVARVRLFDTNGNTL